MHKSNRLPQTCSIIAVVSLILFLCIQAAHAASFDCAKASTDVENTICADAELSKLDELLSQAYVHVLRRSADPSTVKAQQRTWLRNTRDACVDPDCLKAVCKARIAVLSALQETPPAPTSSGGQPLEVQASKEKEKTALTPRVSRFISYAQLVAGESPSDLYDLVWAQNPGVCRIILRNLHEPVSLRWEDITYGHAGDLFMKTGLGVPWQKLKTAQGIAWTGAWHAKTDLNGDGEDEVVLRVGSPLGGWPYYRTLVSEDFTSGEGAISQPRADELVLADRRIRKSWKKRYGDGGSRETRDTVPGWDIIVNAFVDVLVIDNESFVMVADAAAFYSEKPVRIAVYDVKRSGLYEPICAIEVKYIIRPE